MKKIHTWHTVVINYDHVQYFYKRENNDVNGNARYRVFILDPDLIVYETIFKCYESEIVDVIINFFENK